MFGQTKKAKLMYWSLEILIIAAMIFIFSEINFIFQPLVTFFSTLFAPLLIAGFLYYLLNPVVGFLTKYLKMKRILAIAVVFLLLIAVFVLLVVTIIPNLILQLTQLANSIPSFISTMEVWIEEILKQDFFKQINLEQELNRIDLSYGTIIQKFLIGLSSSISSVVGTVASAAMLIITVPFILFYMLKSGDCFSENVQKMVPKKRKEQVAHLLTQLNETLSKYISGQAIECIFVATFTFLGYQLVGVEYAFLFGMIAGVTNLIPYLGPYLGLLPAVVVTIFNDPVKALLCVLVVLVVQQVDGNIIYPNVIGKSLAIHPLTIILILLVAGNLAGILGIFLAVPFYAICRTILLFIVGLFKEAHIFESLDNSKE